MKDPHTPTNTYLYSIIRRTRHGMFPTICTRRTHVLTQLSGATFHGFCLSFMFHSYLSSALKFNR